MGQTRLISLHLSRHEDEACHAKAETDDWDVFDALFEDDVDAAVEVSGVGCPPEVDPVIVQLPKEIRVGNEGEMFQIPDD